MPFIGVGATIEVHFKCSGCGHEGHDIFDGDEFVDNTFGVNSIYCPNCGLELNKDDDLDNEDDALSYEEDEEDEDY
jgi:predicted RNA-binding Zn-ribbon protein involved in translation (DUF1610 family)